MGTPMINAQRKLDLRTVTLQSLASNPANLEKFLRGIQEELVARTYRPTKNRRVEIPKGNGRTRKLGIPTIKDRVVQGAVKLILEPIFEADFQASSFAYRPKRTAHQALDRVVHGLVQGLTQVIDVDLKSYFDNIRHHHLLQKLATRVEDPAILHLVKQILKWTGILSGSRTLVLSRGGWKKS